MAQDCSWRDLNADQGAITFNIDNIIKNQWGKAWKKRFAPHSNPIAEH